MENNGVKKKRKKWDEKPPNADTSSSKTSSEFVSEIDERKKRASLVARLISGKDSEQSLIKTEKQLDGSILYFVEITINDINDRLSLCRSSSLNEIKKLTGCTAIIRGSFIPKNSKPSLGSRPLYMHLSAKSEFDLIKGQTYVNNFIEKSNAETKSKTPSLFQFKLSVPIDLNNSMGFDAVYALMGSNNNNIKEIEKKSNCSIILRGKGTNIDPSQPLHFFITSATEMGCKEGRSLSDLLISNVMLQMENYKKEIQLQQQNVYYQYMNNIYNLPQNPSTKYPVPNNPTNYPPGTTMNYPSYMYYNPSNPQPPSQNPYPNYPSSEVYPSQDPHIPPSNPLQPQPYDKHSSKPIQMNLKKKISDLPTSKMSKKTSSPPLQPTQPTTNSPYRPFWAAPDNE